MRFYTTPPKDFEHPYLMLNPNWYKEIFKREFEHAILDCGVEFFKTNPDAKEYPRHFLALWKYRAQWMTDIFGDRLWVTIPDYPDDYHPGQFKDNIGMTLRNVEEFIQYDGINWIVTIQSRFQDHLSFYQSLQKTKEIVGDYPRIAIGTVCKSRNKKFIVECVKAARKHFPNSHIHAFGPTLSCITEIKPYLDSFDSMAWCYPRKNFKTWSEETGLKPFPNAHPLCMSEKGRHANKIFWTSYLKRLNELGIIADFMTKDDST